MGYQADVGHDVVLCNVWGNLYHEHGRGKLDWNEHAVQIVKKGDWDPFNFVKSDEPITTDKLKIEVNLQDELSAGILSEEMNGVISSH